MTGSRTRLALLLVTVTIASGFVDFRIRQFVDYPYATYIPGVIDGTYGAPAIYRVLVPFGNTWLAGVTGLSPAAVWHTTRLAWLALAFVATYAYLRTWFSPGVAASGVLAVAATLPLTYTNSWAHADSIPELALFTLGCLAIVRRWPVAFGAVLVVAALNRETAVFLVLAYLVSRRPSRSHLAWSAGFAGLWAAVFIGLRAWRGVEHYEYWQFSKNLEFLKLLPPGYDVYKRAYAWFLAVLAAPAIVVIVRGWRFVPPDARRLLAVTLPFLGVAVTISSIIETRIFIPLYPLAMPALLAALECPVQTASEG